MVDLFISASVTPYSCGHNLPDSTKGRLTDEKKMLSVGSPLMYWPIKTNE